MRLHQQALGCKASRARSMALHRDLTFLGDENRKQKSRCETNTEQPTELSLYKCYLRIFMVPLHSHQHVSNRSTGTGSVKKMSELGTSVALICWVPLLAGSTFKQRPARRISCYDKFPWQQGKAKTLTGAVIQTSRGATRTSSQNPSCPKPRENCKDVH